MDQDSINSIPEGCDRRQVNDSETVVVALMEKYGSDLKKLAFTYVRDWEKAEDIVQDVFIACYENLNDFRGDSTFKTWLFRITVNRCKDWLKSWPFRHIHLGKPAFEQELASADALPERETVKADENRKLAEKVMALPLKYKEVIILHYYSGLKTEEVAESLKTKANTVRTRLRRARALLKKMYEEDGCHGKSIE
ncbi:MAG TPA: sigma-70 family RNA polymerase sigma factor [Bacillales bacterium]|nr:sigma-70 family RNA polymerase sigma factor [Bacillales bacterium]